MIIDTKKNQRIITYPRGSIWWLRSNCNDNKAGSVQKKKRPVIIVSTNDRGASTIVEVLTITSQNKTGVCSDINIKFINAKGEINFIQCNQHMTVDISELYDFQGIVNEQTMHDVNRGMLIAQGMKDIVYATDDLRSLTSLLNEFGDLRTYKDTYDTLQGELVTVCKLINEVIHTGCSNIQQIRDNAETKDDDTSTNETSEEMSTESSNSKTKPPTRANKTRKASRRNWTVRKMKNYLADSKTLTTDEMRRKYHLSSNNLVYTYRSRFLSRLNKEEDK